jgi:hypothetical protein
MVDALAPDRSDQPFSEGVLPRRGWGDGLITDTENLIRVMALGILA